MPMSVAPSVVALVIGLAAVSYMLVRAKLRLAAAEALVVELRARDDQSHSHASRLVQPVAQTLARVDARLDAFDRARTRNDGALHEHLQRLHAETAGLSRALRHPAARGRWGELQLRRLVELAGLSEQVGDFAVQTSVATDDAQRLRPDMVVRLPNGRCVVIDAKAPLDAYLDAQSASDEQDAQGHLARHAQHVRTHIALLASKSYHRHVDGALPDFVVLFLPAEHLFSAALREQPNLLADAYARGVMLASPTTLLALLHAVAHGWREQRLSDSAADIGRLGRELHDRVVKLTEHMSRVGRSLDSATTAYNSAVGALESRVLVTTRRICDLDVPTRGDATTLAPFVATERARAFRGASGVTDEFL